MSTPISTLPMKTQQGANEANDINDPIVQDVLNEFQEELMLSKQPRAPLASQQAPLASQQAPQPPHPQPPPYMPSPHASQYPQYPPSSHASHASHASQHSPQQRGGYGKYDNISSYLDTEVAKKSLILVILAVIIYHSGIVNTVYEKMPEYLQDNLNNFDIYIKSASLFSIIYVLTFFEYI
uniref:Uncharacterized protein n=1 Tax=viral metagenome TaxID=1070528 RepID=A0A6C0K5W1_9ZZZZ